MKTAQCIKLLLATVLIASLPRCEKETYAPEKSDVYGSTDIDSYWDTRWKRVDVNTGMFIDTRGSRPIFCSGSDWSKYDFSEMTSFDENTVEFTITNPATGGYYVIHARKNNSSSMSLIQYKTNLPTDFSNGEYTKTTSWCDNDSGSNTGGSTSVGNTGGNTGTTQTTGEGLFWTSQNHGCGPISITFNGSSSGSVSKYYSSLPSCGSSGNVTVSAKPGTYSWSAECDDYTWSGSITITAGTCSSMRLD